MKRMNKILLIFLFGIGIEQVYGQLSEVSIKNNIKEVYNKYKVRGEFETRDEYDNKMNGENVSNMVNTHLFAMFLPYGVEVIGMPKQDFDKYIKIKREQRYESYNFSRITDEFYDIDENRYAIKLRYDSWDLDYYANMDRDTALEFRNAKSNNVSIEYSYEYIAGIYISYDAYFRYVPKNIKVLVNGKVYPFVLGGGKKEDFEFIKKIVPMYIVNKEGIFTSSVKFRQNNIIK